MLLHLNWRKVLQVNMSSEAEADNQPQIKRKISHESLEQLCCDKVRLKIIARKILRNVVEPNL